MDIALNSISKIQIWSELAGNKVVERIFGGFVGGGVIVNEGETVG